MDLIEDVEMPSPKRQRTDSQIEARKTSVQNPDVHMSQPDTLNASHTQQEHTFREENRPTPGPATSMDDNLKPETHTQDVSILDALMQHVESEAEARRDNLDVVQSDADKEIKPGTQQESNPDAEESKNEQPATDEIISGSVQEVTTERAAQAAEDSVDADAALHPQSLPEGLESVELSKLEQLHQAATSENLPVTSETLVHDHVPPATETASAEQKEWQTDSSPYSSSTDTSDDSSDSSDEDSDDEQNDYQMLDPYEQARILMADAGSDDEDGNSKKTGGTGASLRTANEKVEQVIPKPDIEITEGMTVEELGHIENIVEHTVLIRAKTSGEYQVLESNSLLCLENRKVIGVVAETLGRVEQPLYTVRFASQTDIEESRVSEKGTKVFYVKDHSTFVFTQPLKGMKGSDASNFHDEEVGDDEMEFSDDEAEAEHKRMLKLRRKGIDPADAPTRSRGRGRGGRGRAGYNSRLPSVQEKNDNYDGRSVSMNYDDADAAPDMADGYTPLQRPSGLVTTGNEGLTDHLPNPPPASANLPPLSSSLTSDRGAYRGRGRGRGSFFDHNRAGRRGQGQARGGRANFNNFNNFNNHNPSTNQNPYIANQQYPHHAQQQQQQHQHQQQMYNTHPHQSQTFNFHQQQQHPLPPPPPLPQIIPQNTGMYAGAGGAYGTVAASMMGLPGMQYGNFQFGGQQQQQQQQQQYPAFGQGLQQNHSQNHGQNYGQDQNQNLNHNQNQQQFYDNSAAMAQVQRQLEDLRRQGGHYS